MSAGRPPRWPITRVRGVYNSEWPPLAPVPEGSGKRPHRPGSGPTGVPPREGGRAPTQVPFTSSPPGLLQHPGNAALWTAAAISAASLQRGVPLHLHAEGPRGTGKTTLLRAVAGALPALRRVAGCPYNCDPAAPHCPLHRDLEARALRALGEEGVPVPFIELSASAKLATAVGSVDLRRLVDPARPEAALLPGGIARAHRGILFVDEINRLADVAPELTDCLLDVMGTKPGRLQIEEAGLPTVQLPLAVTVWAASNPDEEPGPLEQARTQLADRFDLRVPVEPPDDVETVLAILTGERADGPRPGAAAERHRARAAGAIGSPGDGVVPTWPTDLLRHLADTFVRARLGSLRALFAWRRAAEMLALLDGVPRVRADDVRRAAHLALRGRAGPEALAAIGRGLAAPDGTVTPSPDVTAAGAGPSASGAPRPRAAPAPGEGTAADAPRDSLAVAAHRDLDAAGNPVRARRIGAVRPLVAPEWTERASGTPEGGTSEPLPP